MNLKGKKAKKQAVVTTDPAINTLSKQELNRRIEVIEADMRAWTWRDLETGRKFRKNDKLSFISDDMLIVKGVNFFPSQVEQALLEIPGVHPQYQIIIENHHGVKDVHINVEAEEGVTGYMVEKKLKETLGFSPKGDVFKPGELPRQAGKAQRVFYEEKN